MSYKDKPIIKLYKFENNSFVMQAQIDDFQEVSFEHNIYEAGTFTITINYNIPNALLFQRGLFCQFGNNPYDFGEIITIQDAIGQDGKGSQIRTITGRDARYILKRRVIKNMNSNGMWAMTDKGEIVLRNLIKDQCGSSAEAKRQLPIANTIPSGASAKGKEYSASENFSNLYEVCKTIATQSEIGWRMAFDGTLTLEVFEGADLSQTVRFDTNYESLANGDFSDSSESYSNAIYIGGKGQNDDRDIYEGEDGTPQGLDRFESWDNQSSLTVESEYEAEALSMLTQYGQTLTMNGNGLAKCPYVFREQYDIGDTVTVAFSGKSAKAQILSITEHWTWGAYDISFAFGKPQNNLSDQLQLMLRKIQEASNKTNSTDSVRWYTIPTDTAMPKADVTYNTIGFVGTVGTGATFTLYLDNEKTGAKTYHVYFKQLGGTGKLTLTTGKAGATNLTLNSGTYVAIIYVDENGNVTNTASTPTATIEAGSTQPATSGGVSQAIENVTSNFSDLPKDAVLHYSFDEVPDLPDGSAVYRKNNDFTSTSDWSSAHATLSIVNAKLKVQSNADGQYFQIYGLQTTASNMAGKILKIRCKSNAPFTFVTQDNGGSYTLRTIPKKDLGGNEYEIMGALEASYSYTQMLLFAFSTTSTDNYVEISQIYIGDGSYSTPVIDNANGQNNATNNGGLAVQGVSGKGAYFLNGKTASLPDFHFTANFSTSIWVKPDNNTPNQMANIIYKQGEFVLINGNPNINNLLIWLYGSNSLLIDGAILGDLLPPNIWTHLAVTREDTTLKVYKNAVLIKTFTLSDSTINVYNSALMFGMANDKRSQSLDDFQYFNRALSETEVQALYLNKANTPKYYSWADWRLSQL